MMTRREPRIRPESVIYDPELTLGRPVAMSVVSGLNAIAQAVEGLYATSFDFVPIPRSTT